MIEDVIDLHVDSFIWTRLFGYDLLKRHGRGPFGGRLLSQADLPRLREAGVTGAIWSITTNPLQHDRLATFQDNLESLRAIFARAPNDAAIVRTHSEYMAARAAGKHAAFLGIQGGNALDRDLEALDAAGDWILRITLVHLSTSRLGVTSAPFKLRDRGLTEFGRAYVQRCNRKRIFVDLAHINRKGFFDAVAVHDKSQPLIVTHTGVNGAHAHWRNLDDEQIKAIADTGGTIGIVYHTHYLGSNKAEAIVHHMEHVIRLVGDDYVSLGSDWDGFILPPRDMPTCLELQRLFELMTARGWTEERVRKIAGGNFLRALKQLRP